MPCGWGAERAATEAARLRGSVGAARVRGVDGAAFCSRPGPRVVDGVELLASIFHPDAVAAPDGAIAGPVGILPLGERQLHREGGSIGRARLREEAAVH